MHVGQSDHAEEKHVFFFLLNKKGRGQPVRGKPYFNETIAKPTNKGTNA
jgi:hypothetical protein